MTKSQNTKNEQHCIKQNEKSFIQKDLSLTELWQKGELPSGWYYVRLIRGESRIDLYINGKNEWIDCPDNIIDTVVCEVPSYEEYEQLENWNRFTADYHALREAKEIAEYEKVELLEKVKQLKDLLMQSRIYVKIETEDYDDRTVSKSDKEEAKKLLIKIDEVLK